MSWEALPAHNEKIVGDELYSLILNYKWRKIISEAIDQYLMNWSQDDITLDNQDLLDALYLDLYDGSNVKITTEHRAISANRTTTNAAYTDILDTALLITWQHSKASIKATIYGANSGANNTWFRPAVNGVGGSGSEARVRNGTEPVVAMATFENLPIGTQQTVTVQFRVNGGTGTAFSTYNVVYEIIEYD